jgi:iron complex transport system substrate-binding protein
MVGTAGGVDVGGTAGEKSVEVPWERLATLAPDVVLVMPCGFYVEDAHAQAEEHRERIAALGVERVFAVDAASTYSRPGPRLVEGTELLAHLFHPERVEAPAGIGFADLSAAIGAIGR